MNRKLRSKIYPMWIALPGALVFTVFFVVPIIIAFFYSFTNWNLDRMDSPQFIGLRNFINLFQDEVFARIDQ